MLAYFPAAYPGELLYSVLARYRRHVGTPGPAHTLEVLFGKRTVITTFDLPGHLNSLVDRIPPDRGLNADTIIDRLTLYPYFTAFEPPAVQEEVRQTMRIGNIDGLHLRLGLAAFRVGRIDRLRFCPECAKEMQTRLGEMYWKREHQLSSVMVCPEHCCPLRESTVSFSQSSRHEFIAATADNCQPHSRSIVLPIDRMALSHLHRLACRSADLLSCSSEPRTFAQWTTHYRNQMSEIGLAKSSSKMDQRRLHAQFRKLYGKALEHLPNVMDRDDFAGDWLSAMVRKHRYANHPLYHLLVQDFLAHQEQVSSPFGRGPWPCINPLARHRSALPIKTFTQHRNRRNTVGVFTCSCGYVYTQCLNSETGIVGPPRFLQYGPLLDRTLRKLVTTNTGLRKISRTLDLDPKTVVRVANELGIALPWNLKPSGTGRRAQTDTATPMASKTPEDKPPNKANYEIRRHRKRRDWQENDKAYVSKLTGLVQTIHDETPPVRITVAELERRVIKRGWMLKRRSRLPQTMAFLERAMETVDAFQLRRIQWAIADLARDGGPVKAWQVLRKAGLRSEHTERILRILEPTFDARRLAA